MFLLFHEGIVCDVAECKSDYNFRFLALALGARSLALSMWPRGVTVSTLDSESSDRGSNPREALHYLLVVITSA